MRSRRSLWSWQSRHLSLDRSLLSLTWQLVHCCWLSNAAWLCDSGPGERAKKSPASAVAQKHSARTTRARVIRRILPGTGPRIPDVHGGESGQQDRERDVDLLPRVEQELRLWRDHLTARDD